MDFLLATFVGFDLIRTLRTGRARTWMNGTATREHQPGRYWRYVYGGYTMLLACVVVFIWAYLLAGFAPVKLRTIPDLAGHGKKPPPG